jgi:hypothetical protein
MNMDYRPVSVPNGFHPASRRRVMKSSDRQKMLGRAFLKNRIALGERVRHIGCDGDMREREFTTRNQTCRRAAQVLQFVVLNCAIGVAIMMMTVRGESSDGRGGKAHALGYMGRVLAQQRNDATDLGDQKQPG